MTVRGRAARPLIHHQTDDKSETRGNMADTHLPAARQFDLWENQPASQDRASPLTAGAELQPPLFLRILLLLLLFAFVELCVSDGL